jgi:hypothetical protein
MTRPAPVAGRDGAEPGEGFSRRLLSVPWGPPPAFVRPPDEARAALAEVYAGVPAALGPAAGACCACGACCRFAPGGVVLFASALEMAALVAGAGRPDPARLVPGGAFETAWACPYQDGEACGARPWRSLGCRTHFCDAAAGERGRALHDDALARICAIARDHQYPWWYGPAKVYLDAVAAVRSERTADGI